MKGVTRADKVVVISQPARGFLELQVTANSPKDKKYLVLDNLSQPTQVAVYTNSAVNIAIAIKSRVFDVKDGKGGWKPCPQPIPGAFKRCSAFKTRYLRKIHAHALVAKEDVPSLFPSGLKRDIYQRAVESLRLVSSAENLSIDSRIRAFVKCEKVVVDAGWSVYGNDLSYVLAKDPRIIQPRTPRYNVILAQWLKRNEHQFFRAVDKVFGEVTVLKGMNAARQAKEIKRKWDKYQNPIGIRLDASRFDQHVSKDALKYEHSLYLDHQAFKELPLDYRVEFHNCLRKQRSNRGVGYARDGQVRYGVEGNRMSGDMNTGLGNVLIMCSLMWTFLRRVGVRASLVNNGDDCCIICEAEDEKKIITPLKPWFDEMGFDMTIEGVARVLEKIKFCQCHPIELEDSWIMVRDPHISMGKDLINLKQCDTQTQYDTWRAAIAGCGLALTSGVPVAQAFYMAFGKDTSYEGRIEYCGMAQLAAGLKKRVREPHWRTRVSFYKAFGVMPDVQEDLEQQLQLQNISRFNPVEDLRCDGVIGTLELAMRR